MTSYSVQFKLAFPESQSEPDRKRQRVEVQPANKKLRINFTGDVIASMELDSPIKAGEYEVSILPPEAEIAENGHRGSVKRVRKWESISGGSGFGFRPVLDYSGPI